MGLGLLFQRLRFGEKLGKVVECLTLPSMQLTRMNLMRSGNLGDRSFLFEHLQHDLRFERRGMTCLLRHNVSSVTLQALQICLVSGDHYTRSPPRCPFGSVLNLGVTPYALTYKEYFSNVNDFPLEDREVTVGNPAPTREVIDDGGNIR